MAKGEKDAAEAKNRKWQLIRSPAAHHRSIDRDGKKLNDKLILLPNLPSPLVPAGKTPQDNVVVREGGKTGTSSECSSALGPDQNL